MLVSSCQHEAQALSDIFCRFVLGEGMTKKSSDLASEVEEQTKALQAAAADKKEAAAAAPAPEAQGIKDEDVPDIKVTGGDSCPDVLAVQRLKLLPFSICCAWPAQRLWINGSMSQAALHPSAKTWNVCPVSDSAGFHTSLSCMVHH